MDALSRMKEQAADAAARLREGDLDAVGALLDEGWALKRQLSGGISNAEIDGMYECARRGGALGGKIAGAGGGGFLLVYCPLGRQAGVRQALAEFRELPFHFTHYGTRIIFNIE